MAKYRNLCKKCTNRAATRWHRDNPEKRDAACARWRKKNSAKEFLLASARRDRWEERNPGRAAARARQWYLDNTSRHRATTKKIKLQKRNAVPLWADLAAIRLLYEKARQLSHATGIQHHVDHIIPLTNPLVCGLHVEHNLRVIPARENLRKSNRLEEVWL